MSGQNHYLLTALPGLGELGSDPPMTSLAMLDMLDAAPRPRQLASVIFLADDLQLRQAVLAGEIPAEQAKPTLLSAEQLRDQAPLPECLAGEEVKAESDGQAQLSTDRVWAAYFTHAANVAADCNMLVEWVRYEVGLRNALASARAKTLGLDIARYLVTPELGCEEEEYSAVLGEWSAASDPLAGLRALDTARWAWIDEHGEWFSFKNDELAAYAARLVILHRWKRITAAQSEQQAKRDRA